VRAVIQDKIQRGAFERLINDLGTPLTVCLIHFAEDAHSLR
jgi:hypothetical protein